MQPLGVALGTQSGILGKPTEQDARESQQTGHAPGEPPRQSWAQELVRLGRLNRLDRPTFAETLKEIRVFEDGRIEITYLFSEALRVLLEETRPAPPAAGNNSMENRHTSTG